MIATRVLRIVTVGLAGLALAWAAIWWQRGQPLVAALGALAIATAHAWLLGAEFVLLAFVNRGDPAPPATAAQLWRAWWREVWLDVGVFGWRQPFRSRRYADRLAPAGRRGVVLVHGFLCNRGIWNPWLEHLLARDIPVIAVDFDDVFGAIDGCAPKLDDAVRRLEQATELAPLVVAHSMGGLVVRAWLDAFAGDDRVHRVVTIGTPHQGTWLARFAVAASARQMRCAGEWLAAISRREPASRAARFTCFYSHCDNVVFPASTATLPGADNRHVAGAAHVELAFHPDVLGEAMRWLESQPAPAAAASPPARRSDDAACAR